MSIPAPSYDIDNPPSLKAVDIKDRILEVLYSNATEYVTSGDVYPVVFHSSSGVHQEMLFNYALQELDANGYIKNHVYTQITFLGRQFFESAGWPYRQRPHKYDQFKQRVVMWWKAIKVIAGLLNALAILFFAGYSIYMQKEFNSTQLELQQKQIEDNKVEQEEKNKQFQKNFDLLNQQTKGIEDIKKETRAVNQPLIRPDIHIDFNSEHNLHILYCNLFNSGNRDAVDIRVEIFVKNLDKKPMRFIESISFIPKADQNGFSETIQGIAPHNKNIVIDIKLRYKDIGTNELLERVYLIVGKYEQNNFVVSSHKLLPYE